MEGHVPADDPTNNDEERSDSEGDLDTGANGNAHGQVHLVPDRNNHGGDMFCRISHDWNQYQTDEVLAYASAFHNIVDAAHEVIGADGHEKRRDNEDRDGGNWSKVGCLLGVLLGCLVLGVEKVAVGSKLEDEVKRIEAEEDDGGSAGENQNAAVLLIFIAVRLVENGVELVQISHLRHHKIKQVTLTAAGKTREADDRVIMEQVVCAMTEEKVCSVPAPVVPR